MRSIITFSLDAYLQIRVLDAKIGKLELQLNSEQEKISSCSGLLEKIISNPQGSPCSSVPAELDRARAKRDIGHTRSSSAICWRWRSMATTVRAAPLILLPAPPATSASARSWARLASLELIALYQYAS
jgi:hypothetical protein